jgi:hypothetical protein
MMTLRIEKQSAKVMEVSVSALKSVCRIKEKGSKNLSGNSGITVSLGRKGKNKSWGVWTISLRVSPSPESPDV